MDSSESSSRGKPSPRKELQLQSPRSSPLKLHDESHKVKKPPVAQGAGPFRMRDPVPSPQQTRAPMIIYVMPPKVIHTEPSNFMTLVQRLTGASPATSSTAAAQAPSLAPSPSGCPSPSSPPNFLPASQFATVQDSGTSSDPDRETTAGIGDSVEAMDDLLGIGSAAVVDQASNFPEIVSSMPPSPNSFSPLMGETASQAFFDELSPILQDGNRSNVESPNLSNPSNIPSSSALSSPGAYWDPFNQL